jgi:hypothetical protein
VTLPVVAAVVDEVDVVVVKTGGSTILLSLVAGGGLLLLPLFAPEDSSGSEIKDPVFSETTTDGASVSIRGILSGGESAGTLSSDEVVVGPLLLPPNPFRSPICLARSAKARFMIELDQRYLSLPWTIPHSTITVNFYAHSTEGKLRLHAIQDNRICAALKTPR